MRRLLQGITLGLVLALGVGAIRQFGQPTPSATAATPTGPVILTQPGQGQWWYWELPDTPVEAQEAQPRLTLEISLWDKEGGQPVTGEVSVSALDHTTDQPLTADQLVCQAVASCRLTLPADRPDVRWRLTVQAAGYQPWRVELRAVSRGHRTLQMPIRLQPLALPGVGA